MALKELSTSTMVAITSDWLDPERGRPFVERFPLARALLPKLRQVHQGLLETQLDDSELRKKLSKLGTRGAELDDEHDRGVRGIHDYLTGVAHLAKDRKDAKRYLALRDHLIREGRKMTQRGWSHQAGAVVLVEGRVTDEDRALLRSLPLPEGRNLLDAYTDWVSAGRELGCVEAQRVVLASESSKRRQTVTKSDVAKARNRWIRVVHTFRDNLALDEPDAVSEAIILGTLRKEEG